ncbi:hypothetical protein LCGC14_3001260 [marine sediment metagenome]|uniref:Uncharacterized protein n=1 Tax=marine sediment metagenome TaxID=412755 RepID=A0A0F8XNJ9_9ZZZZ
MPTLEEQLLISAEPGLVKEPDLEARIERLEKLLDLLLSDEAIGNALKGPLRLSEAAVTDIRRYAYLV